MDVARTLPARFSALAAAVASVAVLMTMLVAMPAQASSSDRDYLFDALNDYRGSQCIPLLNRHSELDEVAQNWAKKMAQKDVLEHNPSAGSQIPSGWKTWGENVAWNKGHDDPAAKMMSQWRNSPGHNVNMLREAYTHVGIGFYIDSNGKHWGVQLFAGYSGSTAPVSDGTFCDVPSDHPFASQIQWLADSGVTSGYGDGTFRPGDSVTRQAFAAFLYRFAGEPAFSAPSSPSFDDVGTSHPFYKEIEWLADSGVAGGYDDGTFRPGNTVSRQAMSAFLYRYAGEPDFTPPSNPSFSDVSTSHPFFKDVEWLTHSDVANGYDDGGFRASAGVSRQAFAAFLSRFDEKIDY